MPTAHSSGDEFQLPLIDAEPVERVPTVRRQSDLRLKELSRWAGRQARTIARTRRVDPRGEEFLLAQTVKLGEEVGELYAEILGSMRMQRSAKIESFTDESMRGELADVLICTAIIAELMNIDLSDAVRTKMDRIDGRNLRSVESSKSG